MQPHWFCLLSLLLIHAFAVEGRSFGIRTRGFIPPGPESTGPKADLSRAGQGIVKAAATSGSQSLSDAYSYFLIGDVQVGLGVLEIKGV